MKLLIVKLSALGDVVHTFAFVNRLHEARPDIEIDWLVGEGYAELVRQLPGVRKAWHFRRARWDKWWLPAVQREIFSLVADLRRERYDACLDLQGLLRSGLLTLFSGANERAGLSGAREGSRYCYDRVIDKGSEPHAVDILLKALAMFDVTPPQTPSFAFPIPETASTAAHDILRQCGIRDNYIVFHPGARWKTKLWPEAQWRELAGRVAIATGLPIIFTGSADDAAMIERIIAGNSRAAQIHNLAGKVGLTELAAVLKGASVMVTIDSGPMHIAAAFHTSIVAVFGPTSPAKTGPCSHTAIALTASVDCAPCFDKRCSRKLECMTGVEPADVEEKVIAFLKGKTA